MLIPIVGASYRRPAQRILEAIAVGEQVILQREPDNQHDSNAIKVLVQLGAIPEESREDIFMAVEANGGKPDPAEFFHVGYIPREMAEQLADWLDSEYDGEYTAEFAQRLDGKPAVEIDDADLPEEDEDEDEE